MLYSQINFSLSEAVNLSKCMKNIDISNENSIQFSVVLSLNYHED